LFQLRDESFAAGKASISFLKASMSAPFLPIPPRGGVNVNAQERTGSFNADVADGRHFEFVVNDFADLEIFHNQRRHILGGEPSGAPVLNIT
jgi:hypothetical protein